MSDPGRTTVAIVVAAGSGERLGASLPKALVELAGRPLLAHALDRLAASGAIDATVVVHAPGFAAQFVEACRGHDVTAMVPGGAERTDSVRNGVAAAGAHAGRFAIHDAARCLTPPQVIARVVAAVGDGVVAAAPGVPVADTLKRTEGGRVTGTVDRAGVWAVHTPQVVDAGTFRTVLSWADDDAATDDLGLVESALAAGIVSGDIVLVDGDARDLKITYPEDLAVAADLLQAERRGSSLPSGSPA